MPFIGIGLGVNQSASALSRGAKVFEFTINTANLSTGSTANNQFKLPLVSSLPLDAKVDWGDGSSDVITVWNQAETTHTYASSGIYTIKITGKLSGWRFNNGGDRLKMLDVVTWGALNISTDAGFYGCTNLTASATDAPLITTSSLREYFRDCTNFNGAIGNWDVSAVTNMLSIFRSASSFNQNLESWDVSSVTDMGNMFLVASAFNQNIGSWNVQLVTNMFRMFNNANAFNNGGSSDINNWDTSSVTNMGSMFNSADAFNQNLGSWDVSNVTDFSLMFYDAINFNNGGSADINNWTIKNSGTVNMSSMFSGTNTTLSCKFNRYIGDWNTSAVSDMSSMFARNTAFNQDISDWNINQVSTFTYFMLNVTLSTTNYDLLLVDWEANLQSAYPGGVDYPYTISISFGSSKYTLLSAAATARASLITNFGWTITDGGGI